MFRGVVYSLGEEDSNLFDSMGRKTEPSPSVSARINRYADHFNRNERRHSSLSTTNGLSPAEPLDGDSNFQEEDAN